MMRQYTSINILVALAMLVSFAGCSDEIDDPIQQPSAAGNVIQVGGIELDMLNITVGQTTRAVDGDRQLAERVPWLVGPLTAGLDITYGYVAEDASKRNEHVAKLKLKNETNNSGKDYDWDPDSKWGIYSFIYQDGPDQGKDAKWYGNGLHYFQGLSIPEKLFEGKGVPEDLSIDQHDDSQTQSNEGNYTLLERYLGMPATTQLSATISRVLLPFRHRLAHVVAYVLIDTAMIKNVTLEGYDLDANGKDNPTSTAFRFCNVQVLKHVNATKNPVWTTARKAIPHFMGERGSYKTSSKLAIDNDDDVRNHFYVYTRTEDKKKLYPANEGWRDAHDAYTNALNASTKELPSEKAKDAEKSGYTREDYGKVPCYDLIVRPTYTKADSVMYDEIFFGSTTDEAKIVKDKNKIDFELALSNGLKYQKSFSFDLNANYETIVYLRIDREGVDYNTSGAELWDGEARNDNYYGVNNQNGNTLSEAGSSWQRAYRAITIGGTVTDGHYYDKDEENAGQYLGGDELWIKFFCQACKDGEHHGDYFILDHDIAIPSEKLPADFVFTGHLDAQDHTITISGESLFAGLNGTYTTKQEDGLEPENWEANVHKETRDGKQYWVPFKGWRAEVLNAKVKGGKLFSNGASITGNVQNCFETNGTVRVPDHTPALPQY